MEKSGGRHEAVTHTPLRASPKTGRQKIGRSRQGQESGDGGPIAVSPLSSYHSLDERTIFKLCVPILIFIFSDSCTSLPLHPQVGVYLDPGPYRCRTEVVVRCDP
jgi:hypothetical protein